MRVVAVVVGLGALAALAGAAPASSSRDGLDRSRRGQCPVTDPGRADASLDGQGAGAFNSGNARLRVNLWPGATLRAGILPDGGSYATINRDGSIRAKVGWWVRDLAKLVIVGKRLDRAAPPLRAIVLPGYGPQYDIGASLGFQPSTIIFPTVGCWRVVGTAGAARLTFVVKVTKVQ